MSLISVDISSYDAFRSATLGNGYDVDGVYGYQCVDMAKLLAGNAGRPSPYWLSQPDGYAYEGWTNQASRDYNMADLFDLVTDKSQVRRGDLVVLQNTSSNPYGHIAFADENWSAGTNYAMLLGQNQVNPSATQGHVVTLTSVNVSTFLGAFRFKGWQRRFPWFIYYKRLRQKRQGL
jgi:hypothetical protein